PRGEDPSRPVVVPASGHVRGVRGPDRPHDVPAAGPQPRRGGRRRRAHRRRRDLGAEPVRVPPPPRAGPGRARRGGVPGHVTAPGGCQGPAALTAGGPVPVPTSAVRRSPVRTVTVAVLAATALIQGLVAHSVALRSWWDSEWARLLVHNSDP